MAVRPVGHYMPTRKVLVEGAVRIIYQTIYQTVRSGVFTSVESINPTTLAALTIF